MNFLRILIVDDDATVRIGLKTLIAWEQYGYQLIGEAADGKQAIEIVRKEKPHIVITDMKMPVMDGLTLIRILKEEGFTCAFLVLSSYDDFALVKGAIKLGATDYLLKLELDDHALLACLNEIREKNAFSDSAGANIAADSSLNLQTKVIRNIICNYFFTEEEMFRQLKQSGIHFDASLVYCFFIKINNILRFEESTEEEYYTLNFSIINVVTEISNDCFEAHCVEGKTGEFYVLAAVNKDLQCENEQELVFLTAKRLHEMLWQYLNLNCTIGISHSDLTLTGIRNACHQAVEAAKSHYYLKNDSIIVWGDCPKPVQKGFLLSDRSEITKMKQQLKHALSALQKEETDASLLYLEKIISETASSKDSILSILLEVFICVREVLEHYGISSPGILSRSWRTYTDFLSIQNIPQAICWIDALREDLCDYIESESQKEYQNVVLQAKKIIDKSYSSKLFLSDIAMSVHLDPSYLSSLMRQHLGMSYSEYLTSVRMDHAKQLLANTYDKISSIAEAVGYPDQFYFNRLFKRIFGLTPGEYRKRAFLQRSNQGGET